ncbi:MAG: hotdog fold thioesterase [Desulfobacterales bacterium]|jgi:1,4-dihydroxy-2-naphthoyl-CoA hydrolase
MSIWKTQLTPHQAQEFARNTMVDQLDMRIVEIGDDYVKGTMPVDHRTRQPYGLLHGGASVALAETLGSFAAHMAVEPECRCVGLEINANHLRSKKQGLVTGIARPVHLGRSTQIWDIRITDEAERLICISRLTLAVLKP